MNRPAFIPEPKDVEVDFVALYQIFIGKTVEAARRPSACATLRPNPARTLGVRFVAMWRIRDYMNGAALSRQSGTTGQILFTGMAKCGF